MYEDEPSDSAQLNSQTLKICFSVIRLTCLASLFFWHLLGGLLYDECHLTVSAKSINMLIDHKNFYLFIILTKKWNMQIAVSQFLEICQSCYCLCVVKQTVTLSCDLKPNWMTFRDTIRGRNKKCSIYSMESVK